MTDEYPKNEYFGECMLCGATTANRTLRLYPRGICGACCVFPAHIPDRQHGEYIRMKIKKRTNG